MIRRAPLSLDLLQESHDALKAVVGILDDVSPALRGPRSTPLDLHLALGLLDRIYALESAVDAEDPVAFRRAMRDEYTRFEDPGDLVVP